MKTKTANKNSKHVNQIAPLQNQNYPPMERTTALELLLDYKKSQTQPTYIIYFSMELCQ